MRLVHFRASLVILAFSTHSLFEGMAIGKSLTDKIWKAAFEPNIAQLKSQNWYRPWGDWIWSVAAFDSGCSAQFFLSTFTFHV